MGFHYPACLPPAEPSSCLCRYVPGAGDDEETWACGLTATAFWQHWQYLLCGSAARPQHRIARMMCTHAPAAAPALLAPSTGASRAHMPRAQSECWPGGGLNAAVHRLPGLPLAVCSYAAFATALGSLSGVASSAVLLTYGGDHAALGSRVALRQGTLCLIKPVSAAEAQSPEHQESAYIPASTLQRDTANATRGSQSCAALQATQQCGGQCSAIPVHRWPVHGSKRARSDLLANLPALLELIALLLREPAVQLPVLLVDSEGMCTLKRFVLSAVDSCTDPAEINVQ